MDGATLAELAAFAGADLHGGTSRPVPDTPALGPADEPLRLDPAELDVLYDWFDLGLAGARRRHGATPRRGRASSTVQLWPEHFDAGTAVYLGTGRRCEPRLLTRRRLLGGALRVRGAVGLRTAGRPAGSGTHRSGRSCPGRGRPTLRAAPAFVRRGLELLAAGIAIVPVPLPTAETVNLLPPDAAETQLMADGVASAVSGHEGLLPVQRSLSCRRCSRP